MFRGLATRMMLFLSLALLPLGLVAYLQNAKLSSETRAKSELSLAAVTVAAASGERRAILRALGGAQALTAAISAQGSAPETCRSILSAYLDASAGYSFAGVIPRDGRMTCSSNGATRDFSGRPGFEALMSNPRSLVTLNPDPPISQTPVLIVSEPIWADGALQGFLSLSIPSVLLRNDDDSDLPGDVRLLTFNSDGDLLSSRAPLEDIAQDLPAGVELADLVGQGTQTFLSKDRGGAQRIYVIAPLVDDLVYALSIWPVDHGRVAPFRETRLAGALPFAMWGASVIVAFLAMNVLVVRPIRRLGRRMRLFARSRLLPDATLTQGLPHELQDMEQDFQDMAHAILRDEAAQENALREKTLLLREVHHRVKNNLQLISSIMNMQMRNARHPETRRLLGGLQDRVRSLATVHRSLYETETLSRLDAGTVLSELVAQVEQMTDGQPAKVRSRIASIEMLPDQVVPLSLLLSEGVTNAMKHASPDADGETWIDIALQPDGDRHAELVIRNSAGGAEPALDAADTAPSGLGQRLIRAFAAQLGAALDQGADDGVYTLRLRFFVEDTPEEPNP